MSASFENLQKRRLISSYFSVVLSIALVLFLLGLLGMLVLNAKKVSDHFKEQVVLTIYLKDTAKDVEIKQLEKSLAMADYVKTTEYVSKEQAAEFMKEENGEDFMDFLGYNPLENSIDIYVKAEFVSPEKMEEIEGIYTSNQFVSSVSYDKPLIDLLTKNVRRISLFILVFCGLATLVVVVLINSSIRLSVYSKRFTIKTMQMVGATKRFIRKPFIWNSVKLGMIGAALAIVELAILLYYMNKIFPEFGMIDNRVEMASLFGIIFGLGVLLTWISTFMATQRFLNLRTDELYY